MSVLGVLNKARLPVKIWSPIHEVETGALDQLTNVANLPFIFKWVAAMADVHLGVGACIGSVIATKGAIIPSAVGVDISCGMACVKLKIESSLVLGKLPELRHSIERSIPVGHNCNNKIEKTVEEWHGWAVWDHLAAPKRHHKNSSKELFQKAKSQMGTLGGGNHFIEICTDTEGYLWVMLHSGSRNIGKSIAETHISEAKALMGKMFIQLPDLNLAYFSEDTVAFDEYILDLMWAQEYALANRKEMMRRVLKDISHLVGLKGDPVPTEMEIDCPHNFAVKENHFGENVWITRKGAVRAREGDLVIIPGSMGSKSFIVRGLGNPESFQSCSHGAGRKMSRSAAKKQFTMADIERETQGIECRKDLGILDEIPSAYKNIDSVMANQKDLVEVVAEIKQVLCVKG